MFWAINLDIPGTLLTPLGFDCFCCKCKQNVNQKFPIMEKGRQEDGNKRLFMWTKWPIVWLDFVFPGNVVFLYPLQADVQYYKDLQVFYLSSLWDVAFFNRNNQEKINIFLLSKFLYKDINI